MQRVCFYLLMAALFLRTGIAGGSIPELDGPMGVTFEQGGTTFRVWAPNAESVAVIGDFNGWRARTGDQLVMDRRTGVWSGTLRGSQPRGAYQFLINETLRRRDPYGRAVTPDGTASLFYDPNSHRWSDLPPPRYALEDLVIYEMHIGSFNPSQPGRTGTFADAIRRLDELVKLGVNTLCILPLHEFNGSSSWGYNPSDLFAVEQAYGGPDEFKRFVEACHQRGLAVHLDIVHNHYGPQNLDLLQFDGTGQHDYGGIYFYDGPDINMTPWGPRVRFQQPMVRRFIWDNAAMWLQEYRVDGFRWDSTINIRAYRDGQRPIPEGARMLADINERIRIQFPDRWSIAEDALGLGGFHGSWDYDFHHQVMPVIQARTDLERDMQQLAQALHRQPGNMWRVIYVDNHDEAGRLNGQQRIASDIDPQNPGSEYARRLSGLAALLTFTAPGIPLLFMGNEFQQSDPWHDDRPLDWSNLRRHAGLWTLHRDLIALRRDQEGDSTALKGLRIQTPLVDNAQKHLVYWRGHERQPRDTVVVAINFSGEPAEVVIPFPSPGPWRTRLNTDWVQYGGATPVPPDRPFTLAGRIQAQTRMAPYSARIFTLTAPAATPVEEERSVSPPPQQPVGPFSIWSSLFLTGSFNDWDPTAWALRLVEDQQWEGLFFFDGVEGPRFKITANGFDDVFWGRPPGRLETAEPMTIVLRRLASEVALRDIWRGLYRFHFHESTRELTIERMGDDPLPEPEPEAAAAPVPYREWTSASGAVLSARLLEASFASPHALLEREDGEHVEVPIRALSPADRQYVREWIEGRE